MFGLCLHGIQMVPVRVRFLLDMNSRQTLNTMMPNHLHLDIVQDVILKT